MGVLEDIQANIPEATFLGVTDILSLTWDDLIGMAESERGRFAANVDTSMAHLIEDKRIYTILNEYESVMPTPVSISLKTESALNHLNPSDDIGHFVRIYGFGESNDVLM